MMLVEFSFSNYRSFRDKATLSMEAAGLGAFKNSLISCNSLKLLPGAGLFGKNGGGKSNVIRAFWLAAQFIQNAQRTQHDGAHVPVTPFLLDEHSAQTPSSFAFIYVFDQTKYWYGFSATREKLTEEYLYHAPKGQKALVFRREGQEFTFTEDRAKRSMIAEAVAENQLFFSVACTMNDAVCVRAMRWFREHLFFSQDYSDLPSQLIEYAEDSNMLRAISDYAKAADLGIDDVRFEFDNQNVDAQSPLPAEMPEDLRAALTQFLRTITQGSHGPSVRMEMGRITAKTIHPGENGPYELNLTDESDGTKKLMALAPAIESVLQKGGVLLADELERELHPTLVNLILSKFQRKRTNPNGAQIIFTTHNTELLNLELLRKDQIYLVDKQSRTGVSELYSISDFATRTSDNIHKGYLIGKYGAVPNVEVEEVE